MVVKDFMTKNPIVVSPETSFTEALKIMRDNKIRRLPVVENGQIVGIVTEKDLLYASPSKATTLDMWELHYVLSKLKVKEIMTKDVITIQEDTPLEEAANIMAENKIGALPVLNSQNQLVGIITETDIFKTFIEMLGAKQEGIRYAFETVDKPGIILELSQKIYENNGNIIAFSTLPTQGNKYYLVMKVKNINHEKFLEDIKSISDDVKLLFYHEYTNE